MQGRFVYDANGNLTRKTDAKGVQTDYVYDGLNRVTNRNYSTPGGTPSHYQASPNVSFFYDGSNVTGGIANSKGKLTKVSSSVSTTEYTGFDILGRVTGAKQTTDGTEYATGYTYTLGGALDTETYPSGRVVKNEFNTNGDLALVESKKNASSGFWTYANSFTYNAAGAVTSMQLGNGRWESTVLNSRLQPTQIALGTIQGGTDQLKLEYTYSTTGNHDNNGNVLTQTITVPTVGIDNGFVAVQSYNYDSLNRLKDATENVTPTGGSQSQSWKQTFTYDRYGNRNFDQANTTQPASFANPSVTNPTIDLTNNRFASGQGYSYDTSGNTTADANGQNYVYDGENKMVSASDSSGTLGQYWYDGDGKRIKKVVPETGEETIFVYDAAGKEIAEYSTVVANSTDAKVNYLTSDSLGSPRINTDQNGAVTARHDYMPFGEEIGNIGGRNNGDDPIRKKFTGYERDDETELDFAEARMYASALGRFNNPDPLYIELRRLFDPQQINLYNYTRNNPLRFADSTGLDIEVTGETTDDYINRLQQDVTFRISRNAQTGKVQIVDANGNVLNKEALKKLEKALEKTGKTSDNKAERELFTAITDTKNHVVIDTVRESGSVDFGRFDGNGHNTIDSSDLAILDNSSNNGGFTAARVVGHETLEAYHSAVNGTTMANMMDSHNYANAFFGGIQPLASQSSATFTVLDGGSSRTYTVANFSTAPATGVVTHVSSVFNIQGTSTNIRIEKQFVTPVPVNAITMGPHHIVDVRREP